MTTYHMHEARIWEAYCAWQATGRNDTRLLEIAEAFDVTVASIWQCYYDHTAD